MPGGVLGYECNGDGHYNQSRCVYCYLSDRVGVNFGAKGACEFSMFQTRIHRGRACRTRG